jgi:hypothetical protein
MNITINKLELVSAGAVRAFGTIDLEIAEGLSVIIPEVKIEEHDGKLSVVFDAPTFNGLAMNLSHEVRARIEDAAIQVYLTKRNASASPSSAPAVRFYAEEAEAYRKAVPARLRSLEAWKRFRKQYRQEHSING